MEEELKEDKMYKKVILNIISFISSIPFAIYIYFACNAIFKFIYSILNFNRQVSDVEKFFGLFIGFIGIVIGIVLIALLIIGVFLIVYTIKSTIKLVKRNKLYIIIALIQASIYFEIIYSLALFKLKEVI